MNQIENIVRGFRAKVIGEIQHHRTIDGAGVVASFAKNVEGLKALTLSKLEDCRSNLPGEALEAAATNVNDIAAAVIERVTQAGQVEFTESAI
jgi:hypothetical protein